jgi:hypothetical protein
MPLLGRTIENVGAILAGVLTFAPEVYYGTKTRPESFAHTSAVAIAPDDAASQLIGVALEWASG